MGQIVSKAMIWVPRAVAGLMATLAAASCSSSSSQSGGGWPDSSVEGGDDATIEAGDDVGNTDAPGGDSSGQACPCGAAFKSCPASRPCVIGVATEKSCAGFVCCGPASDCDGGADGGDAATPPKDAGARDGARDGSHDGSSDAKKD